MSLSNDQLEERILVIEQKLDEMQIAINALATKRQLNALMVIRQEETDDFQQRITALETQVALLQED